MSELLDDIIKFWNGYESVLYGEWNNGLSQEEWDLLERIKTELEKAKKWDYLQENMY